VTTRPTVAVSIRGKEFRIRTDSEPEALQRVASLLDQALSKVERKTGTVDSLDVALLTGLNLARELIDLRETQTLAAGDAERLRTLIELAESGLEATSV
jgi:cell division protein ZapA (FtsZ GTPase activity inhibitor)